jgi:lysozyme
MGVPEQATEKLLRQDLPGVGEELWQLVHKPLTNNQFSALLSSVPNAGNGSLQTCTLLRRLNKCALRSRGQAEACLPTLPAEELH